MDESPHGPEPGPQVSRRERTSRQRRRRGRRVALAVAACAVVVAAVFFAGLVIGRALEDAPRPGGEQTIVRTLVPATVGPAVTVTVTEP